MCVWGIEGEQKEIKGSKRKSEKKGLARVVYIPMVNGKKRNLEIDQPIMEDRWD